MRLPDDLLEIAKQSPVYRTTAAHLAVRILHDDIVWLLRVVCGRDYLGEIVRTEAGRIRVHVWAAIDGPAPNVCEILERKVSHENTQGSSFAVP